jgi:hypothetical protein
VTIYLPLWLIYTVLGVIAWTLLMMLLTRAFDPAMKLERLLGSPWPRYIYIAIFGPLAWGAGPLDYYDTLNAPRREAEAERRRRAEAERRRREDREWGV